MPATGTDVDCKALMTWGGGRFGFTESIKAAIPATAGAAVEFPQTLLRTSGQITHWQPGAARWIQDPRVDHEYNASFGSVPATAYAPGADAGCVTTAVPVLPAEAMTST